MNKTIIFLTAIPLLFIILGFLLFKFPPKKINIIYGYKTINSMKDINHWNYAQKLSGKISLIGGIICFILSIIGCLLVYKFNIFLIVGIILITIDTILIISIIIITEIKLHNHFK